MHRSHSLYFFVLSALTVLTCATEEVIAAGNLDQPRTNIINGTGVAPDEFPQFALLKIYQPDHDRNRACSATMIASNKVLTAGHCIDGFLVNSRFTVIPEHYDQPIISESDDEIDVIDAVVHPNYDEKVYDIENDIAVLTLARHTEGPVASVLIGDTPLSDKSATGYGIGLVNYDQQELPEILQKYTTTIVSNKACQQDPNSGLYLDDRKICVSPRMSIAVVCFGDSGGPLMVRTPIGRAVAGIASYADSNCFSGETYVAYTRVTEFTDFIKEHSPRTRFIGLDAHGVSPSVLDLLLSDQR